jgi:glycosyltransferase involved in cell wall biosynthesis
MTDKTLIFVPCYNCETQIKRVISKLDQQVINQVNEVLILDNRSKDDTLQEAIKAAKCTRNLTIKIAQNQENYGLGGSHKAAFRYAIENNYDYVIVLHGDDQGDIRDAISLFQSNELHNYDAHLGSRFMKQSKTIGYSPFRFFGNYVFNGLFSIGSGHRVYDLGSGLNIFSKTVFQNTDINLYSDDLRFNIYLLLGLFRNKLNIKYFPIHWSEDDQISNVKLFSQARKTISLLIESIAKPREFAHKDHREKPISNYLFDVKYEHKPS